jgi:hypothetical protein
MINNPNKTASPQGPDPEAPDGLNAPTPDPGELSPELHASERRESKPSVTQNPMTPRVSALPADQTPTSPLQGHPDDPMPWSSDPERREQQAKPAGAKATADTKPTTKAARSKRDANKQTPPARSHG